MSERKQQPLVSAIIPVYNGENHIINLYKNIRKQRYENIEIIFVDNNSSDNSVMMIKELMRMDKRIKLFHEKIQGAGSARNKGVSKSKGDFITFFDVDDDYSSQRISALANVLINHQSVGMAFGKEVIRYKNGRKFFPNYDGVKPGITDSLNIILGILQFNLPIGVQASMCRKEVFKTVGGFEPKMKIGEDFAFTFKLSLEYPVFFLPKTVLTYNKHSNSTMYKYKVENPNVNYYYDQHRNFYLPYMFKKNYFFLSQILKTIYSYCLFGLMQQCRIIPLSKTGKVIFIIKEHAYLKKFGYPIITFPIVLISIFLDESKYTLLRKVISKLSDIILIKRNTR